MPSTIASRRAPSPTAETAVTAPTPKTTPTMESVDRTRMSAALYPALLILFGHNPRAKIIWAHTGFSTAPQRVAELLDRYTLWGELSYRSGITDGRSSSTSNRGCRRAMPAATLSSG